MRHGYLMIVWVSVAACFLACRARTEESPAGKVTASFRTEKKNYVLGEPIRLTYILTNASSKAVYFEIGNGEDDSFAFDASPVEKGAFEKVHEYFEFGGMTLVEKLEPGEAARKDLLLTDYLWFKEAGTYRITCEGRFLISEENLAIVDGSPLGVTNVGTLEITLERNRQALAEIVRRLAAECREHVKRDVICALATVRDPIVLDPLKVLLERGGYAAELAAKGIRNVGDSRARRILADYAARNPDTDAGRLAAQYARDLEKRSKDHPK